MKVTFRQVALLIFASCVLLPGVALHASEAVPPPASQPAIAPLPPPAPPATLTPSSETIVTPASVVPPAARAIKIGFVDPFRIAEESSTGKKAKAKFKEKADKIQTQLTTKQKQLEKQKAALEAKLPTMPPAQREVKIKEYEKKVEEFRKFTRNADRELQPLQEELTRNISNEIEKAADSYGKANNLSAISVRKELIYLASDVSTEDVTDAILRLMNEKTK